MSQWIGEMALKAAGKTYSAFTTTERLLLAFGSVVSIGAMLGLGNMFGLPREPQFNGSLLAGYSPVLSIVVTAVAAGVCMIVGSMVAAFVEEEGGLFCAAVGFCAMAVRCGSVRPVYQFASGPGVLLTMAFESLLLGAILIAGWWGLSNLFAKVRSRQLPAVSAAAPNELTDATLAQKLTTTGIQVVVMGLLIQVLVQTDVKAQALAGVGVAAFAGVAAAYMVYPLPTGIWYWIGPTILAVLGYLVTYFSADGISVGEVHGWTAALARAVPLDYAGMGTAGALLGYWAIRRGMQEEVDLEPATPPAI